MDTVRYNFLVSNLIDALCPVMLVGPVGTGKTSVAKNVLDKLNPKIYSLLTVNMSAQVRLRKYKNTPLHFVPYKMGTLNPTKWVPYTLQNGYPTWLHPWV